MAVDTLQHHAKVARAYALLAWEIQSANRQRIVDRREVLAGSLMPGVGATNRASDHRDCSMQSSFVTVLGGISTWQSIRSTMSTPRNMQGRWR